MIVIAGAQMDLGVVVVTLLLQAMWNVAAGVLILRERSTVLLRFPLLHISFRGRRKTLMRMAHSCLAKPGPFHA